MFSDPIMLLHLQYDFSCTFKDNFLERITHSTLQNTQNKLSGSRVDCLFLLSVVSEIVIGQKEGCFPPMRWSPKIT